MLLQYIRANNHNDMHTIYCKANVHMAIIIIPYSGFFLRGNIFTNFANRALFVKFLPVKNLKFLQHYSNWKHHLETRENFTAKNGSSMNS